MRINIRNYRGIDRAEIELAPLCIVAGANEAGKTSLYQAVQAALTGQPIVMSEVKKKDAALLVRDGADEGFVRAVGDAGETVVTWPKCAVSGEGGPRASVFAAGLSCLIDLPVAERTKALTGYIGADPTEADLHAEMSGEDVGYGDKAIADTWNAIREGGWDFVHGKASEYGTKLKGQWEAITGERYGARKADDWVPNGWAPELADADVDTLQAEVTEARQNVERALQAVGKESASAENLQSIVEGAKRAQEVGKPALEENIRTTTELIQQIEAEIQKLPPLPSNGIQKACPSCGTVLCVHARQKNPGVIEVDDLVEFVGQPVDHEALRANRRAHQDKEAEFARLRRRLDDLEQERERLDAMIGAGEEAQKKLDESQGNAEAMATLAEERRVLEWAESRQRMALAKINATDLHRKIRKNAKLIDILAPDGLRKKKLTQGIAAFNARLAEVSGWAKWAPVRLDADLSPHYGDRPYWACSASARWRARVVLQVAMALSDGSDAVLIDEADILQPGKPRERLFALLVKSGLKALVCMTLSGPDRAPDLAKAKLGMTVWIESGVAQPVGAAAETERAA